MDSPADLHAQLAQVAQSALCSDLQMLCCPLLHAAGVGAGKFHSLVTAARSLNASAIFSIGRAKSTRFRPVPRPIYRPIDLARLLYAVPAYSICIPSLLYPRLTLTGSSRSLWQHLERLDMNHVHGAREKCCKTVYRTAKETR